MIKQLERGEKVTGDQFAQEHKVTRQVIVKDIAILRASGHAIISTPRGYYIPKQETKRVFVIKSEHEATIPALAAELLIIASLGGRIVDVIIEHDVYQEIRIVVDLASVADVESFVAKFEASTDEPLALLTKGVHYHTVEVETEQQEQEILAALAKQEQVQVVKTLDK